MKTNPTCLSFVKGITNETRTNSNKLNKKKKRLFLFFFNKNMITKTNPDDTNNVSHFENVDSLPVPIKKFVSQK